MGRQGEGWDHRKEMAGTGQAMEQTQTGGGMDMAAVIALAAHVEMQVLVIGAAGVGVVVVVMVVAVELQPEGGADGEGTDDKQGDTHKEFSPGGHGLNMGEVLETDGDQGKNNNTGGMTGPPGQGTATGGEGPVEGERSHCHEVVGTTDHMNGTGGHTGENADQQRFRASVCEFCRRGLAMPVHPELDRLSPRLMGSYCENNSKLSDLLRMTCIIEPMSILLRTNLILVKP